jgi:heptosyltransferase-2
MLERFPFPVSVKPLYSRQQAQVAGTKCRALCGGGPRSAQRFADPRDWAPEDNVTSTVVIQPKQGIGDVIWHLPFIQAIAAASPGGTVTFLALPSTQAKELLAAEPCVAETLYFEGRGPARVRVLNLLRLIAMLRRLQCNTVWILDRTSRPAFAAFAAGVPNRIGLGLGRQSWFITNAGIDPKLRHAWPIEWLTALMQAMNIPFAGARPQLKLPPALVALIGRRYEPCPRPWIVLGLGASHPNKDWPTQHWEALIGALRKRTRGTVFLIGGPQQTERALGLIARTAGAPALSACDLTVVEATALLRHATLYVGPDSGPMNLAVAVDTPAIGLFGATPVLRHASYVDVVSPDGGGASPDGMHRISPSLVLERIERHLAGQI